MPQPNLMDEEKQKLLWHLMHRRPGSQGAKAIRSGSRISGGSSFGRLGFMPYLAQLMGHPDENYGDVKLADVQDSAQTGGYPEDYGEGYEESSQNQQGDYQSQLVNMPWLYEQQQPQIIPNIMQLLPPQPPPDPQPVWDPVSHSWI